MLKNPVAGLTHNVFLDVCDEKTEFQFVGITSNFFPSGWRIWQPSYYDRRVRDFDEFRAFSLTSVGFCDRSAESCAPPTSPKPNQRDRHNLDLTRQAKTPRIPRIPDA